MANKRRRKPAETKAIPEFTEVGSSSIPGMTLRHMLEINNRIGHITWSPDGQKLALPLLNNTIQIWDVERERCLATLKGHTDIVYCADWAPDGQILASGSRDNTVRTWNALSGQPLFTFREHQGFVNCVEFSPDGQKLASASDDHRICIWDSKTQELLATLEYHSREIDRIAWSPHGQKLASCSYDQTIIVWEVESKSIYRILRGHTSPIFTVTWAPQKGLIASGASDGSIRIWDVESGKSTDLFEGHVGSVYSLSFSADGILLASKGKDNSVRIWAVESGETVGILRESATKNSSPSLAFHPRLHQLCTLSKQNTSVRIWDIDYDLLFQFKPTSGSIRYTTAKLVLVGDSGVGKTGLGWRLAHNEFKEHSSTHGQQFWVIPELKKTRKDGTECEAVLWDLAGQHIYRSIHSIFLDDVDASLVLFDPTNRQEPLKGVQFWLEQLKGKNRLPPSVLVGARLDRGAPVLSQQELDQFCQRYGISGGYIGTSAKSGEGLQKLLKTLQEQILWEQMATTVTTVTFKRIKEFVLSLKEKPDRKGVLVRPAELRIHLRATDKAWGFTDAEMMTAVGHLATHGYVIVLKSSSGQAYILLVPELLASAASSIFLQADKHPRELGAINENELLQGKYPIEEFKGLEQEEQQVLLDATVVRFLEHSICFRESYGDDNLLIFPGLIKQKRPLKDDIPFTDDISYIVRGRVENIYATLVVLLGYTPSFNRINQWQNQAQYETESNNICGFRLIEDREGEIELVLYYGHNMPEDERNDFQALFEQFLYKRDVEVIPFPPVVCPNGHRQERTTVVKRSQEGKKSIFCDECGAKTDLPDLEAPPAFGFEASDWLKREEATARLRSTYETNLVRVKGYRRGWAIPRCYISYAGEQREFAERLAHDLADAGVFILDVTSKVEPNDNIIVIDSPSYKQDWESNILKSDIELIRPRLVDKDHKGLMYINQSSLILAHTLKQCVSRSFYDPTHYVINLFDLVLSLYAIPLSHAGFMPLRQSLHQQWEQTLATRISFEKTADNIRPNVKAQKEIYVSYAWSGESERLVNDIDQAFLKKGILITRDKRDLGYKGSIKEFMERMGRGKGVVVVISDKYLKSKNCMFELMQIAENKRFIDRIFPVVLSDANIYDAVKRLEYIRYWENKIVELDTALKSVSAANLQGIREEVDLFDKIRDQIAGLTNTLQDMNTLTPDMHRDSNFQTLYDAVMAKLEEE